jgi:hypothetical protein
VVNFESWSDDGPRNYDVLVKLLYTRIESFSEIMYVATLGDVLNMTSQMKS